MKIGLDEVVAHPAGHQDAAAINVCDDAASGISSVMGPAMKWNSSGSSALFDALRECR